jgi:hypothetical protein
MRFRNVVAVLLSLVAFGACTRKPNPETPKEQEQVSAQVVVDPTPPEPPNSVEVPADIKHFPTFMLFAVGTVASEAEKDGIQVQESMRLFQTDATAADILAFYSQQMKDRGWTTDNQVARSSKVGVTIQQYRRGTEEAWFLVISDPEEAQSSDPAKGKRHVALLPAIVKKPKS